MSRTNEPAVADSPASTERSPARLASALPFDRAPTVTLLVLLPLVSWLWIVVMANDMYGSMTGASAWTMTEVWDGPSLLLLWAMWAVMMTAMMLPSATPLLLIYGAMAERSSQETAGRQVVTMAAGYLMVWMAFSFGATIFQRALATRLLISPMMHILSPPVAAALLFIAGIYQVTPVKQACLRSCQSPHEFLTSRSRAGWSGAFVIGLQHGVYCVGCCWAMMLLLFAGGVMNLAVIAALTAFVAFERLAPGGLRSARISAVVLMAVGLWILVR
jgi:predicted metal-binding membrane protein